MLIMVNLFIILGCEHTFDTVFHYYLDLCMILVDNLDYVEYTSPHT